MKNPMSPLPVFITVTPQPALSHLYSCSHHHGVILKRIPEAVFKWLSREFTLCSKKKKNARSFITRPCSITFGTVVGFLQHGNKIHNPRGPAPPLTPPTHCFWGRGRGWRSQGGAGRKGGERCLRNCPQHSSLSLPAGTWISPPKEHLAQALTETRFPGTQPGCNWPVTAASALAHCSQRIPGILPHTSSSRPCYLRWQGGGTVHQGQRGPGRVGLWLHTDLSSNPRSAIALGEQWFLFGWERGGVASKG